jgi:ABC-type lipopolysaccharide export system ATPase subunit
LAILETLNIPRKQRAGILDEALGELGLSKLAKQKAYTLSECVNGANWRLPGLWLQSLLSSLWMKPFAGLIHCAVSDIQDIIGNYAKNRLA